MPGEVVQLLDLQEIEALWGFSESRIYRAVAAGQVHRYGRPGRQKYYSRAELVALFGEPAGGPNRPLKTESSDKGGNQQRSEYEQLSIPEAA